MLNVAAVLDYTLSQFVNLEDILMSTWSGCVTLSICVGHFGDGSITIDAARSEFKALALAQGINKNTIESYLKPMFEAGDKLAKMGGDEAWFAGLVDLDAADAIAVVQGQLVALGMHSGSDIRAWTKQPGFEAYSKALKAPAKPKPVAAPTGLFAKAVAMVPATRSSLVADEARANALDVAMKGLDAIADMAGLLALQARLSERLAEMQALADALPEPTVGVLPDDAVIHPRASAAA